MAEPRERRSSVPAPAVSPAARERAAELLAQRYAADELTQADLEQRLELVYAANTPAELDAVIADLPSPAGQGLVGPEVRALMSGQERVFSGLAPRHITARARMGYAELDLTRATFAPGITTIDVRAFCGYVQVRLPAGVTVESDGHAIMGFFAVHGSRESAERAASTVRIVGRAVMGFAEVHVGGGRPEIRSGHIEP